VHGNGTVHELGSPGDIAVLDTIRQRRDLVALQEDSSHPYQISEKKPTSQHYRVTCITPQTGISVAQLKTSRYDAMSRVTEQGQANAKEIISTDRFSSFVAAILIIKARALKLTWSLVN
jgi:hypothetical protein